MAQQKHWNNARRILEEQFVQHVLKIVQNYVNDRLRSSLLEWPNKPAKFSRKTRLYYSILDQAAEIDRDFNEINDLDIYKCFLQDPDFQDEFNSICNRLFARGKTYGSFCAFISLIGLLCIESAKHNRDVNFIIDLCDKYYRKNLNVWFIMNIQSF